MQKSMVNRFWFLVFGFCLWWQARLWVQVIRQLRNGVKLKSASGGESARKPYEYELTPYEMMMDDIRSRRYKLRQVMVDGTIPPRVKKDAHAVILEFIRSRPPLRKVSVSSFLMLKYLNLLLIVNIGVGEEITAADSSRFYSGRVADGVDPAARFQRIKAHSMRQSNR